MTDVSPTNRTKTMDDHRIVVGVDGSPCVGRALEFAAHEATRWGGSLHVVCTFEIPPTSGLVVVPVGPFEQDAASIVTDSLERVHEFEPSLTVTGEHLYGSPAAILAERSHGATLLVVGCRGHGELTNLVIGSVSEHLIHHAACPVTVVR